MWYAKTTGGAITAVTLEITDTFANEGVDAANPINGVDPSSPTSS